MGGNGSSTCHAVIADPPIFHAGHPLNCSPDNLAKVWQYCQATLRYKGQHGDFPRLFRSPTTGAFITLYGSRLSPPTLCSETETYEGYPTLWQHFIRRADHAAELDPLLEPSPETEPEPVLEDDSEGEERYPTTATVEEVTPTPRLTLLEHLSSVAPKFLDDAGSPRVAAEEPAAEEEEEAPPTIVDDLAEWGWQQYDPANIGHYPVTYPDPEDPSSRKTCRWIRITSLGGETWMEGTEGHGHVTYREKLTARPYPNPNDFHNDTLTIFSDTYPSKRMVD